MRAMLNAVRGVVMMMLLIAPAMAAEEKKSDRPGGVMVEATTISSTVEAIDYKTRSVTLKGPKGGLVSLIVGEEARNFNQVKKGDVVTFDYAEGIAIDVQKATEAPKMVETESIKRAKLGEKPSGTIETVGFMTARVDEIDYKTRVVKLALPEGQSLKITVGDQAKRFNEVKKGDEVVVQYVQKISIKVTTPAAK